MVVLLIYHSHKAVARMSKCKPDLIDRNKLLKKAKRYTFQTEFGAFTRHDTFIKIDDVFMAKRENEHE